VKKKVAEFILDHRLLVGAVIVLITAVLGYQLRLFRISQSEREDLPDNDPDLLYFEEFCKEFGDTELLLIALEVPDVFTPEVLTYIRRLTDLIKKVDDVEDVVSLTDVVDIRADEVELAIGPLIDEIPTDPSALAAIRERAIGNAYIAKNIVSPSGTATSINAKLGLLAEDETYRFRVVQAVEKILAENSPPAGVKIYLTGVTPLLNDSLRYIQLDLKHYMWLIPVLIIILLIIIFRTLRGAFIPQLIILASIVSTLGLFFTSGRAVNMVTTMLPVLIVVICLSDVIHVIARYYEEAARSQDRRQVLVNTMEHMLTACLMTSLTTAVGFGSLAVSQLKSVKDFGIFSGIGIMLAYGLGMTITPIVLSFLPLPRVKAWENLEASWTSHLLDWIDRFTARDRWIIPTVCLALMAISLYGVSLLRIETQVSKFVPQSAPSIQGLNFIQKTMAGFTTVEMAIEGEPDIFKEPWALREVAEVQSFLAAQPGVDVTFSPADLIKEANRAMTDGSQANYVIPDDRRTIAQHLLTLEATESSELLLSFLSFTYSTARISARIRSMSTAGHLRLLAALTEFTEQHLDRRLSFRTTGVIKLYATTVTTLVRSQLRSLAFSFLIITILMIIHMRSLKLGLLSMIPNIIPVLLTMGMMGLAGISLNVATVMISSIALGIAVDDTIHILNRYRREVRIDDDIDAAIHRSLHSTGRAIIFTSVVIALGYSVIVLSNFAPNRYFGLLTAVTMISALIADLFLTPYLLRITRLK